MTPEKIRVFGNVVCVRDEDEHLDEVTCIIWFNGEDDDNTTVKMTVPAGTFQLRDSIEVVIARRQVAERNSAP